MRRTLLLLAALAAAAPAPSRAQSLPPQSWLFGSWTGGMFPAPPGMNSAACFSQPVVIFTRDLVMRATLTEQTMTQREVETARSTPQGTEFRFAGNPGASSGLLGSRLPSLTGFGCESADVLHVQRRGENEIVFPGCADFPNPLVRCR